MRVVVQRASHAEVSVEGKTVAAIGRGLVVLVGVARGDTAEDVRWMADKLVSLRIFPDAQGQMNRSAIDEGVEVLIVSQFTLLGDCRKGRRPSYSDAAPPLEAEPLFASLVAAISESGLRVARGIFRAMMQVSLTNDGPVTVLLDSRRMF